MPEPVIDPDAFLRLGSWDRPALSRILAHDASGWGAARPADGHPLLADERVAIVTGQQPAVGGGPLYTLVKAAHAIALARRLGPRAVPVFWCASEDHDLGEAGHADLIGRDGSIRRFTGDLGAGRASLRFRSASRWWDGLIGHCRMHLGEGLGTAWLLDHAPRPEEPLGAWTCRLIGDLFDRQALVCVEGHHLRPLWAHTIHRAFDAWPAAALADLRQRLLSAGAVDAFGDLPHAPLFADLPDGRTPLTPSAARTWWEREATVLSPGAALRPILQQAALPAVAYVAGPGELAYHRFLAPLYSALGVPAPTLVPRCSLTLVPAWVARGCARWGVAPTDLAGAAPAAPATWSLRVLDEALTALPDQELPASHRRRLAAGLTRLRRERERLAASLRRADRRAGERPAWGALQAFLHPRGGRQERTLSLFQAVWQYGPGVADRLVAAAGATAPGVHGWVELT
jgi:uncharacterized protein YllA (UPF0747 family)